MLFIELCNKFDYYCCFISFLDVCNVVVDFSCLLQFSQSAQCCCPVTNVRGTIQGYDNTFPLQPVLLILILSTSERLCILQKKKLIETGMLHCISTKICMGLTLPALNLMNRDRECWEMQHLNPVGVLSTLHTFSTAGW